MKRAPRQRITIERNTPAENARGEVVDAWAEVAKTWADLHQLTGRERQSAMQTTSETTWRAYLRYTPGLTIKPEDRILYRDHTLYVLAVIDLQEQHQTIQIDLKEAA